LKSPDLTQSPNLYNDAYLNHILENGKGVMPSFRFLNAQEREALIRYLRSFSGQSSSVTPHSPPN
jgi:mono/diheme cytochrome c family protein